jgi:uncharacterized protein (TIRG00374 family)
MFHHVKKGVRIGLFFGVGIVFLYLVFKRQNTAFQADCAIKGVAPENCSLVQKVIADISGADFYWISIVLIVFMISNVVRAMRWKMMLQAIGYQPRMVNLLGTYLVNNLTNLGIPRSGEVIRGGLLAEYEDIPVEKVLGTIVTDRIFDVIMLLLTTVLALFLGGREFIAYLEENINLSAKLRLITNNPVAVVSIVTLMLVLLLYLRANYRKIKKTEAFKKFSDIIIGFMDGIRSVRNVSSISLFIFYTVLIWVLYYLMLYLAFFSFEPTSHLGPVAGLVVFVFGSLGFALPTPGGMGSYHYLMGEALAMYGLSGLDAFSFTNIMFFSVQIFVNILFGLIALVLLPLFNKE